MSSSTAPLLTGDTQLGVIAGHGVRLYFQFLVRREGCCCALCVP